MKKASGPSESEISQTSELPIVDPPKDPVEIPEKIKSLLEDVAALEARVAAMEKKITERW